MDGTGFQVIGRSPRRLDALRKATGRALYAADLHPARLLHGKVLRSPLPHARIVRIDARAALALPGVVAVATGAEAPGLYGSRMKDTPLMAQDRVRYIGEAVAAVAAEDEETAEEALALIEVEYEELPAVFDPEEALQPGAPLLHPRLGGPLSGGPDSYACDYRDCHPVPGTNILSHVKVRRGDVEAAFAAADYVVEETYTSHAQQHVPIEPHAAVAEWSADGKLTVWTSTQSPYLLRGDLALAFGLPPSRVRVIATDIGGGFGSKIHPHAEGPAALLARKTGRPVRVVLRRAEEFAATTIRHPTRITIKSGVMRDGRLVARQVRVVFDTGAYSYAGESVCWQAAIGAAGPYAVPNLHVDSLAVYTNKVPAGAMRGMGWPQTAWAHESHTDTLAYTIGMDPLEFRRRNAYRDGDASSTGQILRDVSLHTCLERAAAAIDWHAPLPPYRGKGLALVSKVTNPLVWSSAFVKVNEDGRVNVLTSAVDLGTGNSTILAQIAAETLGVRVEDVDVSQADTDVTPFDIGAISDRLTYHMGSAVLAAAADARQQLAQVAAELLEASPADIAFAAGRAQVRGAPARQVPLAQVAFAAQRRFGGVLGRGSHSDTDLVPLDPETGQSPKPTPYHKWGAQAVEVEVDPQTGQLRVLRVVSVHDCGRAIHPDNVRGQIEGAVVQHLGFALQEELLFDSGRVVNPSLLDYRVPSMLDAPRVEPILVEQPRADAPYGAFGVGEVGSIGVAAALGNALYRACGVRVRDLPLTPERILAALDGRARLQGGEGG
ncbi:MAG: xanthine dehydrogenase family protein molybdopterin-binding subunit [Chloroflexi bacterium]|nr:xanthine dehydrogenase family protein molybdopterin-binding subunit [Chloroflexota bacterium]